MTLSSRFRSSLRRPGAPWPPADVLAIAAVRASYVPIALALGNWTGPTPREGFGWLVTTAAVWCVVTVTFTVRAGSGIPGRARRSAVDIAIIAGLFALSGGVESGLRHLALVIPIVAAFGLSPRNVGIVVVGTVVAYCAGGAGDLAHLDAEHSRTAGAFLLSLFWTGLVAVLLAAAREQSSDRISRLLTQRERMAAQILDAEGAERRTLANALHDEPLQLIIAARQDLDEIEPQLANSGLPTADVLDEAIAQLRALITDVHPVTLRQGGLAHAIEVMCARHAHRANFTWNVAVGRESHLHDELLLSLARELITNVAKHARASHLDVALVDRGRHLDLVVTDDGRGIPEGRLLEAVQAGHIGFAACRERAQLVGGRVHVAQPAGGGTAVTVTLPNA